jgi:hypothetical protein
MKYQGKLFIELTNYTYLINKREQGPFFLCPKSDLLIQVLSILAKILSLINVCTINKLNHDF